MRYQDYTGDWPWENFTPEEIGCRCCGELWESDTMPEYFMEAMDNLQKLRNLLGRPILITSGHRCVRHNAVVGGASKSQHLKVAFDCVCLKDDQEEFCNKALEAGFHVARPYPDKRFVHLDMGKPRTW